MLVHSIGPLIAFVALAVGARDIPSPASVGSGLTILTHNDLYGNTSWRDESIIVLGTPLPASAASNACVALGECLWEASEADFLPYLEHQDLSGPYWSKGSDGHSTCINITSQGFQSSSVACDDSQTLPVLCTNSAPLSQVGKVDNSTYWQTDVALDDSHWLTGYRDKHSFRFQGIRYASQPERFTYSSVYSAQGNDTALAYGSQCVQAPNVGSEDCLFLNIWTPYLPLSSGSPNSGLKAVMVNIHGGAFTGGTGNDPTFDGGALTSRGDVVLVTINYRLTTLGFLALDDGVTNGNYGLGDQITALKWIQQHIETFGGDSGRVTILGQSAGAGSVRALMASPEAKGLFQGAIPQSNLAGLAYGTTYSEYLNISQEVDLAATPILNATGCMEADSQVDCLRGIDPFVLANLTDVARYVVQDGKIITSDRLQITQPDQINGVNLLMGFMRDDGAPFIGYPTPGESVTALLTAGGFTPSLLGSTGDLYPVPNGPNTTNNVYNASSALATDGEFRCLDQATAYSAALHGSLQSLWFYEFNRSYNGYDPHPPVCEAPVDADHPFGNPAAEYFKCHSGELNYAFGSLSFLGLPDRDGLDIPLSQFVVDTWASFARTYDPNPDLGYLNSRGFTNTSMIVSSTSRWDQVGTDDPTLRVIQWPSYQASFDVLSSRQRCNALGLSLDYYES